jgi:hypothetical protein
VEEGLQVVNVGRDQEVWWSQTDFKPIGHRDILIAVKALARVFIDLHVDAESGRVEIEHDCLLLEPETAVGTAHHSIDVLVDGLLHVDLR